MSQLRERAGEVGWVLLPLRGFLAVVYLYAGISKVADSRFLDSSSSLSIHASVVAVKANSPIGGLLGPVVDHSFAFGLLMAFAEVAVGIGVMLGLWTRIAAAGGMLLALSLWLTVSWGATPWFTSADLVYLFAFTPLLIAGSGGVYSVDGWLAASAVAPRDVNGERTRRTVVTAGAAGIALVLLGVASLTRKSASSAPVAADPSPTPTPSPSTPASTADASSAPASSSSAAPSSSSAPVGVALVSSSAVPVGGGTQVKDPVSKDPTWVLQLTSGEFTAYDAICPHQGCTVNFESPAKGFTCPCHGSRFSSTGKLESGPATRGLSAVPVVVADGSVRRT